MIRAIGKIGLLSRLAIFFVIELIFSSLQVAWDVLTPRHRSRPGIVAVPLDLDSDVEIVVLANLISLAPGSLSLDVSDDRKTLYVHEMFVDDPAEESRSIKEQWEQKVREALK